MIRLLTMLALTCFLIGASGCLITSASRVDESGVRVSPQTLEQVEPGETTEQWLVATLGEPTARSTVEGEDGTEILRYTYRRVESSKGAVFLIFGGSRRHEESQTTYFEVTDGVVTRMWTER